MGDQDGQELGEGIVIKELELPTASDLTGRSLLWALELLEKELGEERPQYANFYELAVASQGVSAAAILVAGFIPDLHLKINFEYDVDEWSLKGTIFLPPTNRIVVRVHSPGA